MGMNQVGIDAIAREFARQFNNPLYTITAENYINGAWGCTCIILASPPVAQPPVQSILVTPANPTVAPSATLQMTAMGNLPSGDTEDLTKQVGWNTNPSSVATVDGNGLLTGVQAGNGAVTAVYVQDGTSILGFTNLTVAAAGQIVSQPPVSSPPTGVSAQTYTEPWKASCGYYTLIGPIQCNTPIAPQITPYVQNLQQMIGESPKSVEFKPNEDTKQAQEELQ